MTIYLFKMEHADAFKSIMKSCFSSFGGRLTWNAEGSQTTCYYSGTNSAQAIAVTVPCDPIVQLMGERIGGAWLEINLQESSFWEYILKVGIELVDQFSVAPQKWEEDEEFCAEWSGNPRVLADVWAVPLERIERYLVNWDPGQVWNERFQKEMHGFQLSGKAYPEDTYPYGSVWQVSDFVHALGGEMPDRGISCAIDGLRLGN